MTGLAFLILLLLGISDGQHCLTGHSNYSRREYKEVTKEVNTTTVEWVVRHDDCNIIKEIASWITKSNECDTRKVKREKTVTRNRTTVEKYTVETCCPGYVKIDSTCTQGCDEQLYGTNCTFNCSWCPSFCEKDTGECICEAGKQGNCTEDCDANYYGISCKYKCMCENNSTCNSTDGSCNCTSPGWQGDLCNEECTNNTYGLLCNESCTCNDNQTCDPTEGFCTCKSGWKGDNCSEECDDMSYGIDCLDICTCDTSHTQYCNRTSGSCTCDPGYTGKNCSDECRLCWYGQDCTGNCSAKCTNTDYCDHINGTCICLGTHGQNCTEECDIGNYGPNCGFNCTCKNSVNTSCHNINGQCNCKPGWTGRTCDQECPAGLFGQNCSRNCSDDCTGTNHCDPVNGTCICIHRKGINCSEECDKGYYGHDCNSQCHCNYSNSVSCDKNGKCMCRVGWTGVSCETEVPRNDTVTQKATQNTGNFLDNYLMYIIIPVIGLLLVVLGIMAAIYWRRIGARKRLKKERESLTAQDMPNYSSRDAENIPLENGTSDSKIQMYEDAVLETDNQSELANNHVTQAENDAHHTDNNHETENYDHAYTESDEKPECLEDEYSVPDKDIDQEKLENHGENVKTGDKEHHEELYDSTEDNGLTVENIPNEYNTFQDVIKIHKEAAKKEIETEEDYDVIAPAGSQKKKLEDLEHYSSFEQVRKLSLKNATEEDMYNVLNENQPKHRSAPVNDTRYHHVSLKHKTIDGQVFAHASSNVDSDDPRKTNYDRKLSKQPSLRHDSIDEESEEDKEQTDERSDERHKDGAIQEEDDTEVIYDECDLDEDSEEPKLENGVNETKTNIKLDGNTTEVVYEECDTSDKEESRPSSGALYEDVDDDEGGEADVGTENETHPDNPNLTENKVRHLKKASARRKEDYEDFSL